MSEETNKFSLNGLLEQAEHWYLNNKKNANYIATGFLGVIVLVVGYKYFISNRNETAQKKMFQAEQYFEQDSFKLALNGKAGSFDGFLAIKKKYSMTQAANLCNYYIGLSYLQTGESKKAIEYLKDFATADDLIQGYAYCALADAYSENNDMSNALKYYEKATKTTTNNMAAPYFLMKAGLAYENNNKPAEAKEFYNKLNEDFHDSQFGRQAEAYISRCNSKI
jgi:tetratricopeptide (TPR) repeat protein